MANWQGDCPWSFRFGRAVLGPIFHLHGVEVDLPAVLTDESVSHEVLSVGGDDKRSHGRVRFSATGRQGQHDKSGPGRKNPNSGVIKRMELWCPDGIRLDL